MNICKNCIYYNPMSGDKGFCDRNNEIVEFNEINACRSNNCLDFDFDDEIEDILDEEVE